MLQSSGLARINRTLLFVILISIILYFGREAFVLITFSGLLAMLLAPVSKNLEKRGISRVISSFLSVLIFIAVSGIVVLLLSAQIASIGKELPQIMSRLQDFISDGQSWINNNLGISTEQLKDHTSGALGNAGTFLTGLLKSTISFIGGFILVLVFTFLFLLQRDKYENFVVMLYKEEERQEAKEMIDRISKIAQQYLAGKLVAVVIIAILYIIGFSVIRLNDGLLLASIAAVAAIIPYVGTVIGGLAPIFMAILVGSFNQSVWVIIIILLVNIIDHYLIEPYIVGGSINISPFFAIFILILGGVVWGIPGIILFLPLLGILKIIFENVEGLGPYAYLVGDQRDAENSEKLWARMIGLFSRGRRKK